MRAEHPPHEIYSVRLASRLQVENCEPANEFWANAAAEIARLSGGEDEAAALFQTAILNITTKYIN